MKLIIAGSRTINDIRLIVKAIHKFNLINISEIVSGEARGVDRLGERYARLKGIKVKPFPADWDRYGKSAGYRRNAVMAKYADCLLPIWDGESKGTNHMIDLMKRYKKPFYVYNIKE